MKKTILSVLLVLLLSFVLLGCEPTEEDDPAALSDKAVGYLEDLDIVPSAILLPSGCTFLDAAKDGNSVYLFWTGATAESYKDYKDAWKAAKALGADNTETITTGSKAGFTSLLIGFDDEVGMEKGVSYPKNTLILMGSK